MCATNCNAFLIPEMTSQDKPQHIELTEDAQGTRTLCLKHARGSRVPTAAGWPDCSSTGRHGSSLSTQILCDSDPRSCPGAPPRRR